MTTTLYQTPYGLGELVARTNTSLQIKLLWGATIFAPTGSATQTSSFSLVAPRGASHPASQGHPQFSTSVPHALTGGHVFSLPPAFGSHAATVSGRALHEECAVRPELTEELVSGRVIPAAWHPWLADPLRAQLVALQTTGSGDCLLNGLCLGSHGVQDRTPSLQRGDVVKAKLNGFWTQCWVTGGTPDGSMVALVPRSGGDPAFDGAPLVVPVACVDGEAPSDLACRQAYGLEEDGGEGCGGSGVALGRRWAGLRLLMSLAMRESSGAVFARWARERLAETRDVDGYAPEEVEEEPASGASGAVAAEAPVTAGAVEMAADGDKKAKSIGETSSAADSAPQVEESQITASLSNSSSDSASLNAAALALASEEGAAAAYRLLDEWHTSMDDASTPKRSLLPEHVWVLAQILRRPILVLGARYEGYPWNLLHSGIYLPTLHPANLCHKDPLVLLYTMGHFSAGVFCAPAPAPPPTASTSETPAVETAAEDDAVLPLDEEATALMWQEAVKRRTQRPRPPAVAASSSGDSSGASSSSSGISDLQRAIDASMGMALDSPRDQKNASAATPSAEKLESKDNDDDLPALVRQSSTGDDDASLQSALLASMNASSESSDHKGDDQRPFRGGGGDGGEDTAGASGGNDSGGSGSRSDNNGNGGSNGSTSTSTTSGDVPPLSEDTARLLAAVAIANHVLTTNNTNPPASSSDGNSGADTASNTPPPTLPPASAAPPMRAHPGPSPWPIVRAVPPSNAPANDAPAAAAAAAASSSNSDGASNALNFTLDLSNMLPPSSTPSNTNTTNNNGNDDVAAAIAASLGQNPPGPQQQQPVDEVALAIAASLGQSTPTSGAPSLSAFGGQQESPEEAGVWLSAMLGAARGDFSPIETYLDFGGQRDRKSTIAESQKVQAALSKNMTGVSAAGWAGMQSNDSIAGAASGLIPSGCDLGEIMVRHEQWTCLEMWNGPMATRAPGASSLALSSSPFAGLPRLHRTLSELEVAPTPPPNDEDAYLKPLTEKDFQGGRLRAAAEACRNELRSGAAAAMPLRRSKATYCLRDLSTGSPASSSSLLGPPDSDFSRWTWRPCWLAATPSLPNPSAPSSASRATLACFEVKSGSDMPGAELYRVDLARACLRPPPGLRQWREGVAVVVPLPDESKRELWLRCKTVEEAGEWRHALYDRQLVAQLAETAASARDVTSGGGGSGLHADAATEPSAALSPVTSSEDKEKGEDEAWEGWLPLVDCDGAALRLRFTSAEEAASPATEAKLLHAYLDCRVCPSSPSSSSSLSASSQDLQSRTLVCRQTCGSAPRSTATRAFLKLYLDLRQEIGAAAADALSASAVAAAAMQTDTSESNTKQGQKDAMNVD